MQVIFTIHKLEIMFNEQKSSSFHVFSYIQSVFEREKERKRVGRECLNTPSFSPLSSNFSSSSFSPLKFFSPFFFSLLSPLSLSLSYIHTHTHTHLSKTQSIFTKPFSPREKYSLIKLTHSCQMKIKNNLTLVQPLIQIYIICTWMETVRGKFEGR